MAEDIQGLIEKIKREGIQAAQEKANVIEAQAKQNAAEIIEKAKQEAEKIMEEAKEKSVRTEKNTQALLKQAARDLVLAFKKELNDILNKIIAAEIKPALSGAQIAELIFTLIKDYAQAEKEGLVISLQKADQENLQQYLFSRLKEEVKKGITIKTNDDIQAGFLISYDAGKSYYDFTGQSLVDYISARIKPKLAELFKDIG